MTTDQDKARLLSQIADLRAKLDDVEKELKGPAYPDEPTQMYIGFKLMFTRHTALYSYAAIRVAGKWFTTGATCPPTGYTWKQLVTWMREAYFHGPIQLLGAGYGEISVD
jgi:hypothetical protein